MLFEVGRTRYTEEEMNGVNGGDSAEGCRASVRMGVREETLYTWKNKYGDRDLNGSPAEQIWRKKTGD
jgi:hypothetical protein